MTLLPRINIEEVKNKLDNREPVVVIDTRNQRDWDSSDVKLPGALRIHYSELEQHLEKLPHDKLIVTYCT